jgi:hypothetical protein
VQTRIPVFVRMRTPRQYCNGLRPDKTNSGRTNNPNGQANAGLHIGLRGSRKDWRRRPDLNRGWRFCRPLPYLLATAPRKSAPSFARVRLTRELRRARRLERETGFEPATSTLARSHSTTELFPPGETLNYHDRLRQRYGASRRSVWGGVRCGQARAVLRLRRRAARATSPLPSSVRLAGSGTAAPDVVTSNSLGALGSELVKRNRSV